MLDQKGLKKHGELIISTTAQLLPQLKVAVPAVVAVWWIFKQTIGKRRKGEPTAEGMEEVSDSDLRLI